MFIFDEATSALDKFNEQEVQRAIDGLSKAMNGVTQVVIAHRLSTIRKADKIIVLNKGRVAEVGTHESLLQNYPTGIYSKLVADQEKIDAQTNVVPAKSIVDVNVSADQAVLEANLEIANQKMEECNTAQDKKDEELATLLLPITDKKKQNNTFQKRLFVYNKPIINILIGCLFQTINGMLGPVFGIFIIKTLFAMILYQPNQPAELQYLFYTLEEMKAQVQLWVCCMVGGAVVSFIVIFFAKKAFGTVGENITLNIRSELYSSILKKHVGWHDDQENASGVLSSILASDVQTLNGVSTEALSVMAESTFAMLGGVILAFIFSWKVALVALAITPFMIIGSVIATKVD